MSNSGDIQIGNTPLPKSEFTRCRAIIETLVADPMSEPFLYPVGWRDMMLFDYPKIVQKPMDLNTLKSNLVNG